MSQPLDARIGVIRRRNRDTISTPRDSLLIHYGSTGMTKVRPYVKDDITCGVTTIDRMRQDTSRWRESNAVRQARKVFGLQQELQQERKSFPANVLDNDTLPGRVSLITHIGEFCHEEKAWNPLLNHVKWLNSHRIPHTNSLNAVMELTIGEDSPEKVNKAIAWVEQNLKRDREKGYSSVVAADTEGVNIGMNQLKSLPGRTDWDKLIGYLDHLDPNPLKLAKGQERGVSIPVRMMFGGLDWMLTLRLPVGYSKNNQQVTIKKGGYQPNMNRLLDTMPNLIGQGIKKDIEEMISLARTLWPNSDFENHIGRPVELQWLLRFSGVATSHFGIHYVLWWALHFFAPKVPHVSMGDGLWGLPFHRLPDPLKLYCLVDTVMVTRAVHVYALHWMASKLPDLVHIYLETGLGAEELFAWFLDEIVVKGLGHCTECDYSKRNNFLADGIPVGSINGVIDQLNLPSTLPAYQFYSQRAEWPSVTAGGARFLHAVRAEQSRLFAVLHREFPNVWPLPNPSRIEFLNFFRPEDSVTPHPVDPVSSKGLLPNPGLTVLRVTDKDGLTPEVLEAVHRETGLPRRGLILEAFYVDPEVGAQWLNKLDKNRSYARLLLNKHMGATTGMIIELREAAKALGVYIPLTDDEPDLYKVNEEIERRKVKRVKGLKETLARQKAQGLKDRQALDELRRGIKSLESVPGSRVFESTPAYKALLSGLQRRVVTQMAMPEESAREPATKKLKPGRTDNTPLAPEKDQPGYLREAIGIMEYIDKIHRGETEFELIGSPAQMDTAGEDQGALSVASLAKTVDAQPGPSTSSLTHTGRVPLPNEDLLDRSLSDDDLTEPIPEPTSQVEITREGNLEGELPEETRVRRTYVNSGHTITEEWVFPLRDKRRSGSSYPPVTFSHFVQIYQTLHRKNFPLLPGKVDNVNPDHLATLAARGYIVDDIFDAYFALISSASYTFESRRKGKPIIQYLETWKLLCQDNPETRVIVDYTKLFSCTVYLVPVNVNRNHWGLLALNMYDKKFTYYDSCNNPPVIPPEVHKMISRLKKLSERTSLDWDIASARISIYPNFPQQDGDRDCGVFVLMAARAVANRLPINFTQADVPYFRQRVAAEIVSGTLYSG